MLIQFMRQGSVDPYKGYWQPLFFEKKKTEGVLTFSAFQYICVDAAFSSNSLSKVTVKAD